MFPCVSLQVSLNVFRVLNPFECVYSDDDVSFICSKIFHLVISRKPSLTCVNVFRYDVTVPGSNLVEPMYFFPFLFFFFYFLLQLSL